MPRRILLIGNYSADRQHSMLRYADELARNLAEMGVEVGLVAPPVLLGRFAFGRPALAKWLGHLDKYLLFPLRLLLTGRGYDVVHITDQANAVYRRWLRRTPVVVTCHDLFAVRAMLGEIAEHRPSRAGRTLQRAILANLRQCDVVICTSETTARDVARLLAPGLTGVIPNAIADDWMPMPPAAAPMLADAGIDHGRPFFLHVGGNQFYKNRPGVVALFDHLVAMPEFAGHRLVLAGKPPDARLRDAIERAAYGDRVIAIETPSDTLIRALYSRAAALLFPSLYEGFGWPIVEAQACGCVVVTTDREPMRTVGGDAAILVDPDDLAGAAETIVAGLATTNARRERGLTNAVRYRSPSVYPRYVDFYMAAMANYRKDKR